MALLEQPLEREPKPVEPKTPRQQAEGIAEHFGRFIAGEEKAFNRYFVLEQPELAEVERQFAAAAGINEVRLITSEVPVCVLQQGDVRLYRWSNFLDGEPYDVYYQACRGDEEPSHYLMTPTS